MEHLWSPWRMEYILADKSGACILCEKPAQHDDEANHILCRGEKNYIILNKYPYNTGHLMVVPYRHLASPEELTAEESGEHQEMVSRALAVLRRELNPEGFNTGMNIGKVAGAGIGDHIHTHIVPRWQGDTNFMPVIADARVVPEALAETYRKLKGKF